MIQIRPSTQIAPDGAATGQTLTWDGAKWAPTTPASGVSTPIVARSASANTASGTSVTITLGSAPAVGDLLIACFNISQFSTSRDLTLPAGWSLIDSVVNSDCRICTISRTAGVSEPASFTFNFTGTAQAHSGAIVDVTTLSGTLAVGQHVATNAVSTSVTSSESGDLPLAFFIQNDGTTDGNTTNVVVTSGWATDQNNAPAFHALIAGHGPATTNGVAVAPTATWGGTVSSPMSALVMVAPRAAATAPSFATLTKWGLD